MNWQILIPFFVYLAAIIAISAVSYRFVASASADKFSEEYYVGGRSLGPWVLALSFAASLGSAGAFLGTPALAYSAGLAWIVVGAGQTGSVFVGLGLLGKRIAIVGRRIGAYTIPQILVARFPSKIIKYYIPAVIIVFTAVYMVPQIIGGARVLNSSSGMPYGVGVVVVGLFTVFYTALGGFRAASWVDLMQGLLMAGGAFVLCVLVTVSGGGFGAITDALIAKDPALISPTMGGKEGVGFLFSMGWIVLGVGLLSLPHAAVRGLSFRNSKALHGALLIGTVTTFAFTSIMWFVGVAGHATLGDISVADNVVPLTIVNLFPTSLAGIFLAVPFAAIMSTVASMLLIVSSALIEDIVVNLKGGHLSNASKKVLNIASTSVIGIIVVFMALEPPPFLESLVFYAIGGMASSLLVPLLAGLYWPRANTAGAIASSIGGLAIYLIFSTFLPKILSMDPLAWAILASIILMVICSLITPPSSRSVLQTFWGRTKE